MKILCCLIVLGFHLRSPEFHCVHCSDSPRILGPGIISDGFSNRDMAISPDGNDLYYTLQWTYGLFSVNPSFEKNKWRMDETGNSLVFRTDSMIWNLLIHRTGINFFLLQTDL